MTASSTTATWSAVSRFDSAAGLSSADDVTLIDWYLRTGDEQIFEILVRRYQANILRLATSLLGHRAQSDAEDAVQEVFVSVLRLMRTFRKESKFSTWLYRVARNQIIDYSRRTAQNPSQVGEAVLDTAPADAGLADPDGVVTAAWEQERLMRCVDRLSAPQRATIRLYYWHGQSVSQISELLGLNPGTVRSHLFRARQRLARFLREDKSHE
jgi:RNA polymerase sigma-70 factor (ECF subfamily)